MAHKASFATCFTIEKTLRRNSKALKKEAEATFPAVPIQPVEAATAHLPNASVDHDLRRTTPNDPEPESVDPFTAEIEES
ncbi:hypothetical protein NPIL_550211 [Nephila pilipes]|uniref:Uncharacterized protein n=1 Tax=Nephila pilipes TaxID=299642 RepID=A0A8X6TB97_NEPPI|nr:hypothetical protein NPIL_550211 [Nephila pilipes]